MTTLHVEPRNGTWVVRRDDDTAPISEHAEAGAAMLAAHGVARTAGVERVLMHDRYHRTHAFASTAPRRRFTRS